MQTLPNMNLPKIAYCEPALIKVSTVKMMPDVTPGLSEKQPFCDGTYKRIDPAVNKHGESVMPYKNLKVDPKKVRVC
jgi:hypothetical protein